MADRRPNPDQLLAQVQQQEAKQQRGRLKVFFGMAAGVGKTYAMLEEARKRAAEGADVLIGYAEPHIRTETEALLLGMEILPYKVVEYRNATLKEFDLDAAIARRPALLCVDELAHSNAPGLRHPKRWQDVAELLDAGITVYTTLNVQHLESVNDIVERVTGVRVRETLPDSVLEQADEVELVDIAPEELLERFREGKIYRPDQAERAAKHFFTKGNLIALRELALRTTAQRVDDQMEEARREAGIRTTWAATERVLVCVGPSPMSRRLVRSARRLAAGLRAQLIAVYVEPPNAARLSDVDRKRVEGTLRLADELGAKTVTLRGQNVADDIIAYAQRSNVTKIVIGKPERPRWRDFVFGSVVDDLIRRSGEIDVYVIRGRSAGDAAGQTKPGSPSGTLAGAGAGTGAVGGRGVRRGDRGGFIAAVAMVAFTTAIGWPIYHRLSVENENVLMLYLLGVLWIAMRYSRASAIVASVLSVAAFDLVFVHPYYRFAVSDRQYIVTFAVMLVTALVISALTNRVRAQAEASRSREQRTAALLGLSRELSTARSIEQVLSAAVRHVTDVMSGRAAILLPDTGKRLVVRADEARDGYGGARLDDREIGVAQWAFEHAQQAGRGTNTLPAAGGRYIPLIDSRGTAGVLGLFPPDGQSDWPLEQRQLVEALTAQAAGAIERVTLAEEARDAWERVEAECLRNTLLSGVSHELRTPLAAITGAASAIMESGERLSPGSRSELLETVVAEAERMERLINNLLDMTRVEAGGLVLKKDWQLIQEVIGSALRALERRLHGRDVKTDVPSDLPFVNIDPVAIEQVLTNLLDNAVEYTPPGSDIEITVRANESELVVEVADHGPGIPPGTEKRVFEKFFRVNDGESRRGIGLGLAISRGIIEAHGGQIRAANRAAGGATFTFTLPRGHESPPRIDESDQPGAVS